ncbi:fibrobacter succinogenes major paralogous domain-containing protein [candidate division KSB1 bacterium]|nr:fibrobacter succinogenes major paralogous domain-containing protein [candidate division KSB1 bacterium]
MRVPKTIDAFFFILIISIGFCVMTCDKKDSNPTEPEEAPAAVTDVDGNTYQIVKIGNQWWLKENLKVTHYRNGDAIPNVTDDSAWVSLTTGAYCSYDNDPANSETYGHLYNWYAVNDPRCLAPEGWHAPSDDEWKALTDYLGGEAVAGAKMKKIGTTHWEQPNTGATNSSGLSALPAGTRAVEGEFQSKGRLALFWSSTERTSLLAWFRALQHDAEAASRVSGNIHYGYSVRCVKD